MYMGNEQMNMTETYNHVLNFLITSKIKINFLWRKPLNQYSHLELLHVLILSPSNFLSTSLHFETYIFIYTVFSENWNKIIFNTLIKSPQTNSRRDWFMFFNLYMQCEEKPVIFLKCLFLNSKTAAKTSFMQQLNCCQQHGW